MNPYHYMHELKIFKRIALANGYNDAMIDKLLQKHKNKKDRVKNNKKDKNHSSKLHKHFTRNINIHI